MNPLKYILASILILGMLKGTAQDEGEGIVIDKIIAKVDNYIILKSELEKSYLDYLSRGEFNQGNARCQLLENLVVNKMMVAKAEIDSVIVDDLEVQDNLSRRLDYMISQIGSIEEIENFYGKSMTQIEAELFENVKEQLIIQKMQTELTASLKVSPSEVRKFFKNIPSDSLPYFSTEVTVGQIVKKPDAGPEQQEKIKRTLLEIKGQLLKGGSFAELARLYSEDPGSAANGGELPFYKRGDLAPEYEATAMTLEKGEVSLPVKTQFGYHLIELQEKRGNTFKSRHILMIPKPSEKDMLKSENFLDSLRTVIMADSIPFDEAAKEYSDDQVTSSSGGYFLAEDGATKISVEQLDPNIFFTIDTMQLGDITKPLKFQERDGTYSYRILYYKNKVRPHQANLKDDYQKIATAALNEKRARKLAKWFDEARGDVFIDIDEDYDYCDLVN